ncbi:8846_t:CDS:2 [Entrophospora sp. SA101]|nr:8846_t:CDS:2 [Entrophospora sp. SA101]
MSEVLEEKLKKLIEESRASINWTEVNKWIAEGEPYEEHEEILMFMNQNGVADSRSDEEENILMEKLFTEIPGRLIKRPGQRAILELPPKEPQPPEVRNVNIVIKLLDPTMFPIQSRNTEQMLNNLSNSGLLNNVIGLNVRGRVRKYGAGMTKLRPAVNILLRHIRGRWFRAIAFFTDHSLYSNFLNLQVAIFHASRSINCSKYNYVIFYTFQLRPTE